MRAEIPKLCSVFVLCMLVVGCAEKISPIAPPAPDPAEIKLQAAADTASQALKKLAAIEEHQHPVPPVVPVDLTNLPLELKAPITIDWDGPLTPFLRTLADRAHFGFRESGPPPAQPILIKIDAQGAPLVRLIQDAGLQAGSAAIVSVDIGTQSIEVRNVAPQ